MKKLIVLLMIFGLVPSLYSQVEDLSEVTVTATNYKYLSNVNSEEVTSIPVKELEKRVANFDVSGVDFYHDEYGEYVVSFYIPQGKILAAYNKDGKILRAAERFENIKLPTSVSKAVADRYPGWTITQDVYMVTYFDEDVTGPKKRYKLKLESGNQAKRVKLDEKGNFL